MQLIYDESQKIFIARVSFLEKDIPKNAKFRWDPEKKKWWTDDILKAKVLSRFANESCLEIFNPSVYKTIQSIQKESTKIIEIPSPPGQEFMDFQKIGIAKMVEILENPNFKGVLLADEMGCIDGETIIQVLRGGATKKIKIKDAYKRFKRLGRKNYNWDPTITTYARSLGKERFFQNKVLDILYKGNKEILKIELEDGKTLKTTPDHEILTKKGWKRAENLTSKDEIVINGKSICPICSKVKTIRLSGFSDVYDLVMSDPYQNFVANNIVVHNCGKTIQAIGCLNLLIKKISKVLIVCPATLKINWQRELETWLTHNLSIGVVNGQGLSLDTDIVIINYDLLKKFESLLREKQWDFIIADECFPSETPILTNQGWIPIGEIVEKQLKISVLSYNLSNNDLEWKPIQHWIKNPILGPLVRVFHERGEFTCTINHRIWTEENGYIEAGSLKDYHHLRALQNSLHSNTTGQTHSSRLQMQLFTRRNNYLPQTTNKQTLQMVWNQILISIKRRKKQFLPSILHDFLCSQMENGPARNQRKNSYARNISKNKGIKSSVEKTKSREKFLFKSTKFEKDEKEQSFSQTRNSRKNKEHKERKGKPKYLEGGKRGKRKIYRTTTLASRTSESFNGISYFYCKDKRAVSILTKLLQGRFSPPRKSNSYRNRWGRPQFERKQITRQEKNRGVKRSRVVRIEVLKQGCNEEHKDRGKNRSTVYCLEIADNHNFFASGILVSNCHALKNPNSLRSIFFMGGNYIEKTTENNDAPEIKKKRKVKPIPTKHTILLTGTPILNRPIEIFPLIHFLNPGRWANSFKFGLEFCGGHKNRWGWDFSGSSNSETLQEELRSTIMIRRLKKEVLKELPPKRRQIIEIPIEEIKLKKIIEEEKIFWETNETEKQRLKDRIKELKGGNEEYIETTKKLKNVKNILFQEMSSLRRKTAIAKIPFAIEYLKEILETNEKVVCFAHHKEVIEKIFQHFQENSAVITGSVPPEKRQAEIDRFQNDPGCHLFVGSIKAAGVGITLTAASHAVFVELDWTPAIMSQSEDRLHRKGQEQSVLIQHLVFNNSLDAKMAKMLIEKQKIIDKIVN